MTKVRTVRTEEREEPDDRPKAPAENKISRLIRAFFESGGIDKDPELNNYTLRISVQKFDRRAGRYATLTGTTYDNLEDMLQLLGERYGDARYKFFIKALGPDGRPADKQGTVISDYLLNYDQDADDPGAGDQDAPAVVAGGGGTQEVLEALKPILETMQSNQATLTQIAIAAIQAKGGGGVNLGQALEFLKTGIALGEGKPVDEGDAPADGSAPAGGSLLNTPVGQTIVSELIKLFTRQSPAAVAGAPGPGRPAGSPAGEAEILPPQRDFS